MRFIVSGTTDIGLTKDTNQDSYNVRVFTTPWGRAAFAVLCDGMGGLSKGEVASSSLVNAFAKWSETRLPILLSAPNAPSETQREWMEILQSFNTKIKAYGDQIGSPVGTTATVLLLTESWYCIGNVGDTRVYEIGEQARVLTRDQTVVAQEIAAGRLTPEQAEQDPRRNVLLQCVGASSDVLPEFYTGSTKCDMVYMLCSDGFRHEISTEEIQYYLNPSVMMDADGMQRNMCQLISINKQRQERDNITVITIRTF